MAKAKATGTKKPAPATTLEALLRQHSIARARMEFEVTAAEGDKEIVAATARGDFELQSIERAIAALTPATPDENLAVLSLASWLNDADVSRNRLEPILGVVRRGLVHDAHRWTRLAGALEATGIAVGVLSSAYKGAQ